MDLPVWENKGEQDILIKFQKLNNFYFMNMH